MSHAKIVPSAKAAQARSSGEVETARDNTTNKNIFHVFLNAYSRLAYLRIKNYYKWSAAVVLITIGIAIYRYFYAVDGERQISLNALTNTVFAMAKVFDMRLQKDLAIQSQVANLWGLEPNISRAGFRRFVKSPAFEPTLETLSGMSLIPYVRNENREAFESREDAKQLLSDCCNGTVYDLETSTCRSSLATLCSLGHYSIVERVNNTLTSSPESDTYVVVDYIEPFETNAGVLGFNLASSATRKEAWEKAVATGEAVFTRRIQLVQSDTQEYAFLVWKALYEDSANGHYVFLNESDTGLPVGSVNGVYKANKLLNAAMDIFGTSELHNLDIFLFDALAAEGEQFLAYYSYDVDDSLELTESFASLKPDDVGGEFGNIQQTISVDGADAQMLLVVRPTSSFFDDKDSDAPFILLVWSMLLILASQAERHLGYLSSLASNARRLSVTFSK